MAIVITDRLEKESLLAGYKAFIHRRSLKEFSQKSGYGDDGGGYMGVLFKNDLEDDPYMTETELGIDINKFSENQVLLTAGYPATISDDKNAEEYVYLNFDEFYNYLAEVVKERIEESPEDKAEYEELLGKVKVALEV